MREPTRSGRWSLGRLRRREAYATWMASPAWRARRRAWLEATRVREGHDPACRICGGPWSLEAGDLHHRSYDRLGVEADSDLVPLCRPCHRLLHGLLEATPLWRRLSREAATDALVALLASRLTTSRTTAAGADTPDAGAGRTRADGPR